MKAGKVLQLVPRHALRVVDYAVRSVPVAVRGDGQWLPSVAGRDRITGVPRRPGRHRAGQRRRIPVSGAVWKRTQLGEVAGEG